MLVTKPSGTEEIYIDRISNCDNANNLIKEYVEEHNIKNQVGYSCWTELLFFKSIRSGRPLPLGMYPKPIQKPAIPPAIPKK